jgi:uncharacterized protein YqfB (UPF0267 family)
MVAYSFQTRFVAPILAHKKCQTIRADRRRHARPNELLQLYTGMRTRRCKLIGRAVCVEVQPIVLTFDDANPDGEGFLLPKYQMQVSRDDFAVADGFSDWADLRSFWRVQHPGIDRFEGVLISWGGLVA